MHVGTAAFAELVSYAIANAERRDELAASRARLVAAIEAASYFLVSEALTNVAKYARVDTVSVDVTCIGGTLVVTIADDGVGGAEAERGSGLRGLVDRVDAVGGRLEAGSAPGQGTGLCARLPRNVLGSLNGR